jgi:hypothetical protein
MILDPFFQTLRMCTSFEGIGDWLEDPQNNIPMFRRHLDLRGRNFLQWIEFRRLEFGPMDGLFPRSWAGRMLAYTVPLDPDQFRLVFHGSGIEIGDLRGEARGHHWVLDTSFHMLMEDFIPMAMMQRLRDY